MEIDPSSHCPGDRRARETKLYFDDSKYNSKCEVVYVS